MSFDYLFKYFWLSNYFENFSRSGKGRTVIAKKLSHVEGSKVLVVILPVRSGSQVISRILQWRINRSGRSCLTYYFSPDVLSADPGYTLNEYRRIRDEIKKDLSKIKRQFGYSRIKIIAASLGVVPAMMIANGNEDVDEMALIAPGSCLASCLWSGIRTQKLRKTYQRQGMSLDSLVELWKELAPINNADRLEEKKIAIAVSRSDKVIPYQFGKKLAGALKSSRVEENRCLGHYLSVAKFYFFGNLEN